MCDFFFFFILILIFIVIRNYICAIYLSTPKIYMLLKTWFETVFFYLWHINHVADDKSVTELKI